MRWSSAASLATAFIVGVVGFSAQLVVPASGQNRPELKEPEKKPREPLRKNMARVKTEGDFEGGLTITDKYEALVCKDQEFTIENPNGFWDGPAGSIGDIFKKGRFVTPSLKKWEESSHDSKSDKNPWGYSEKDGIQKQLKDRDEVLKKANEDRARLKTTDKSDKRLGPRAKVEVNLNITYSQEKFVEVDVPRTELFQPDMRGGRNGESPYDAPGVGRLTIKGLKVTPPGKPVIATLKFKTGAAEVEATIEITVIDCGGAPGKPKPPIGGGAPPQTDKKKKGEKKRYDPKLVHPESGAPINFESRQDAFSGAFIGAQFAYSTSDVRTEEFFAANGVRTNAFDDRGSGAAGGLNAGYNWVLANRWLIGVVIEANALADRMRHPFGGGTYLGSTMNFSASALLRAGFIPTANVLLYAQAGPAVANQQQEINFGGPVTQDSKVTGGVAVGGGAEVAVPTGMLRPSLFVDYQHTSWSETGMHMPAASPLFNYRWQRNSDTVRAGFRFRL